jgi:hypothetical protein
VLDEDESDFDMSDEEEDDGFSDEDEEEEGDDWEGTLLYCTLCSLRLIDCAFSLC